MYEKRFNMSKKLLKVCGTSALNMVLSGFSNYIFQKQLTCLVQEQLVHLLSSDNDVKGLLQNDTDIQ